jgi:AcrR family transcriptional regulator
MTNGKMDRRSARTRQALTTAFVELILTRGYEAVTVADIIHRANVGRSTFYLHYAGKDALLQESLERPCRGLAACVGGDATAQTLTPLLEHFRGQRRLNRGFFESPLRPLWVKSLAASIERNLALIARAGRAARRPPLIPRPLLALLLAEMQVALITHWLAGAMTVTAEVIARALIVNTRAMLVSNAFQT